MNKKKISLVIVIVLVLFFTGNVFAAIVGAPNIFFAIKDMVVKEEVKGEESLLSDRDITISFSPIKIKDGVELQVNNIVIEDEKTTLFVTLENKNKAEEQIGINVYDMLENNNTNDVLGEEKFLVKEGSKENFEIVLDKKVSENEKLKLEIIVDGKVVGRNIIVDLAAKEIIIEGKEEIKKVSEKELKEYLGCFSILNDKTLKMNDRLLYVAESLNTEIIKDDNQEMSNREIRMAIIDSFYNEEYTTETVNGIEILKPDNQQYNYDKDSDAYTLVTDGGELPKGKCIQVNDISYADGVYTVEFVYIHPNYMDIAENRFEELQQYQATIKLKLNKDSEYSKYKVISLSAGEELLKEEVETDKESNDSEIKENEVVTTTTDEIILYNGKEISKEAGVQELTDMKITEETKAKYNKKYSNFENGEYHGETMGVFGEETYEGYSVVTNVKKIATTTNVKFAYGAYEEIEGLPQEFSELADYTNVEIHKVDLEKDGIYEYLVCCQLDYKAGEIGDGEPEAYSNITLYNEDFEVVAKLAELKNGFLGNIKEEDKKVFLSLDNVEYVDFENDDKMEIIIELPTYEGEKISLVKYFDNKIEGEKNLQIVVDK